MTPLVLTSTPESVPETPGPRQDYLMLTEALGARLSYPPKSAPDSLLARVEKKTAADLRQAFAALRQRRSTSVYVSLSEKAGLPLALLLPRLRRNRPAHVLIAHHLTSSLKRRLQQRTGYLHRFDRIVALGATQATYLREEAGYSTDRLAFVRHSVDARFWVGAKTRASSSYILSIGRERRDYESFATALRQMPDVHAIVVASSPWSRQAGQVPTAGDAPPNMEFRRGLTYVQLRELYEGASLVVVPVEAGTTYAAGSTGCLEAMAMHKAVVVTATPGLSDYQRDDNGTEIAAMVGEADLASGLRQTITELLADGPRRERLAASGRKFVENVANVDNYVSTVARVVREAESEAA